MITHSPRDPKTSNTRHYQTKNWSKVPFMEGKFVQFSF